MKHFSRTFAVTVLVGVFSFLADLPSACGEPVQQSADSAQPDSAATQAKPQKTRLTRDDWFTRPWLMKAPAFAIADNLYYVGNQRFSSHLVVGKKGMVLIDTPHKEHTFLLTESIRSLGFDPAKITMVLHTHFHCDHTGCTRRMLEMSGAVAAMGAKDVKRLGSLSTLKYTLDFWNVTYPYFEPFEVKRPLKHGDTIDLGGTVIRCHHTPGHTPGTMSYTFNVKIDGKDYTAGLFGGPGLNTFTVKGMYYKDAEKDFAKSLEYLMNLDVDVWIGAHPFVNRTLEKYERLKKGEKPSPFIDPEGWQRSLRTIKNRLERILAEKQQPSEE